MSRSKWHDLGQLHDRSLCLVYGMLMMIIYNATTNLALFIIHSIQVICNRMKKYFLFDTHCLLLGNLPISASSSLTNFIRRLLTTGAGEHASPFFSKRQL